LFVDLRLPTFDLLHVFDFFVGATRYLKLIKQGFAHRKFIRPALFGTAFRKLSQAEKVIILLCLFAFVGGGLKNLNLAYQHFTTLVPARGGELNHGFVGQPHFINPLFATTVTDLSLTNLVFSGLYKYAPDGSLAPDLAEGMPKISEDKKTYTILLRKDAVWHDNTKVTARDVVYTIHMIQDSEVSSPLKNAWLSTEVQNPDDHTVTFKTQNLVALFTHNLTTPIIPAHIWEKTDIKNFAVSPLNLDRAIGSGPYVIQETSKDPSRGKVLKVSLKAFENFYGTEPLLTNVNAYFFDSNSEAEHALTSKSIDAFGGIATETEDNPQNLVQFKPALNQAQVVFLNTQAGPTQDRNVRLALGKAINREKIISEGLNGNATSLIAPIFPADGPDIPTTSPTDMAGAKELLKKAKGEVKLRLVTTKNPTLTRTASLLAETWKELGATVTIETIESKDVKERIIKQHDFDAFLYSYKIDPGSDLFAFWHSSQTKDPGINLSGFTNTEADKLIIESRIQLDPTARQKAITGFMNIFKAETPAIILNQTLYNYRVTKDLHNVTIQNLYEPSTLFYDTRNWYTKTKRAWKFN